MNLKKKIKKLGVIFVIGIIIVLSLGIFVFVDEVSIYVLIFKVFLGKNNIIFSLVYIFGSRIFKMIDF